MIRLSLNRGLIVAKSFSIEAGLIGALQKKDKYYSGYPDSYFTDPTTMTKVLADFEPFKRPFSGYI